MKILDLFGKTLLVIEGDTLSRADLRGADLSYADLFSADLRGADLRGADLSYADLSRADLFSADLRGADLRGADLSYADLSYADLFSADLSYADLRGADLRGADLSRSYIDHNSVGFQQTRILPEGSIIGWKKCVNNVLVKLRIPEEAKRSHAFGRKCRAEWVEVLEVFGADVGISKHDGKTEYRKGKIVRPNSFSDNWQEECTPGIHFFITRKEAEEY